jgi:hypothetical protein
MIQKKGSPAKGTSLDVLPAFQLSHGSGFDIAPVAPGLQLEPWSVFLRPLKSVYFGIKIIYDIPYNDGTGEI